MEQLREQIKRAGGSGSGSGSNAMEKWKVVPGIFVTYVTLEMSINFMTIFVICCESCDIVWK